MKARLAQILRPRTGPMTADLVLHPSRFGLGRLPAKLKPAGTVDSTCGYCSTGCSLKIHVDSRGEALNLSANPDYPVNLGMACPKGWEALAPLRAADRAVSPMLRDESGGYEAVDWERAMRIFCGKFKEIQAAHGRESVAFLSTGQIVTEEMALLGALAKFGMGILHGDGNTRQCMATAVTAYKQSFGYDAPPFTYADLEESDVVILWGSNLCIAHPILWQRVARNRRNPEIIVVDPRRTETAQASTRHFAPKPKTDLVLLYGLARCLIGLGAVKKDYVEAHTSGYEEFARFVDEFTLERVARETSLKKADIEQFAQIIAKGGRVSFWWTMGVNQSHEATRTAQAIINLALMTGNMGRPGTGANSITGQCNAMGSRLYSNTTNLLGCHKFDNPADRRRVAGILGIPEGRIPAQDGKAYDEILNGIDEGQIKGLWVIGTNPAHSWIHQGRAREILEKLEFLVVQDMYGSTETARMAHLVLPAAGWGEKEGTFINSERRIGLVRKVSRPPGSALSDFAIFQLIARYWGCGDLFSRWSSPEAVFQILKELSRDKPHNFSGIRGYAHIEELGGIQWPFGTEAADLPRETTRERRLFCDGRFFGVESRAQFVFEAPRPMPEPTDKHYPFVLLTGRGASSQWHTQTRTAKSDVLRKLYPEKIYVEINPADAERHGISQGNPVTVHSRRGSLVAGASLTSSVAPGQLFIPLHYEETNRLTHWSIDPWSRQPAYKACAVAIDYSPTDRPSC